MACKFDIAFAGEASAIVEKAQQLISDAGGTLTGDVSSGSYFLKLPLGKVEGTYRVVGSSLHFEIGKKPMVIPCKAIETYIRDKVRS